MVALLASGVRNRAPVNHVNRDRIGRGRHELAHRTSRSLQLSALRTLACALQAERMPNRLSMLPFLAALALACGDVEESREAPPPRPPAAVGQPPKAEKMAPLRFFVSNQSFEIDPVDIDVYVDNVKVITGDFVVKNQHNWLRFDFEAGADAPHVVRAVTAKGNVAASATVDVRAGGRWVIVDFWFYGPKHYSPTPPSFSITAHDEEPAFM